MLFIFMFILKINSVSLLFGLIKFCLKMLPSQMAAFYYAKSTSLAIKQPGYPAKHVTGRRSYANCVGTVSFAYRAVNNHNAGLPPHRYTYTVKLLIKAGSQIEAGSLI